MCATIASLPSHGHVWGTMLDACAGFVAGPILRSGGRFFRERICCMSSDSGVSVIQPRRPVQLSTVAADSLGQANVFYRRQGRYLDRRVYALLPDPAGGVG